jgi:hypothetical protein
MAKPHWADLQLAAGVQGQAIWVLPSAFGDQGLLALLKDKIHILPIGDYIHFHQK